MLFSILQRRNDIVLAMGNLKRGNLVPVVRQKKLKNEEGELEVDGTPLDFGLWRSLSLRFWSERRPTSLRK